MNHFFATEWKYIICNYREQIITLKYHRGRVPNTKVWVFGMVDMSCIIGYMERRDSATLLPLPH